MSDKNLIWRDFKEADWLTWSGAERFHDGSAPMVADFQVNGAEGGIGVAVLDASGLTLMWNENDARTWTGARTAWAVAKLSTRLAEAGEIDVLGILALGGRP